MLKTCRMFAVGVLFVAFLGMLPKEEPTLQRLFKPHVLKMSISLWRHVGHEVWCDNQLTLLGRQQNLTRMSAGQGLESKWSMILRVTNVCKSTNASEM